MASSKQGSQPIGPAETARPIFIDIPGTQTPFLQQLEHSSGPVTFINTFVLSSHEATEAFLENWRRDGGHMKAQYGMISGQLHRAIGEESNVFINVAVWESSEAFQRAFHDPAFQRHLPNFPAGTKVYPVLLNKVAVPGICTI